MSERDWREDPKPGDILTPIGAGRGNTVKTYTIHSRAGKSGNRRFPGSIPGVFMHDQNQKFIYRTWKKYQQWAVTVEIIHRAEDK